VKFQIPQKGDGFLKMGINKKKICMIGMNIIWLEILVLAQPQECDGEQSVNGIPLPL
jgi:hypothetical protein